MPEYAITNCTVADAADVARHSMSAFWQDPNWRMLWRGTSLPFLIEQAAARGPRGLLRDRDRLRHYKAVDAGTGRLVGYIRWRLPAGRCRNEDGSPAWGDGQIPDVSPAERAVYDRRAEAAWWETDPSGDVLDGPMIKMKNDLLGKKDYIELNYFAVHPEDQGQGVGTALLAHGIQKAQELGIDIFVLAFVGGFRIYKRMGFKVLDSIVQDATPYGGNDYFAVQYMEFEASKQH